MELRSDRGGADGFESYDLCIIPIDEFKTDKCVYRNSCFTGKTFTYTENYAIPKWILPEEYEEDAYDEEYADSYEDGETDAGYDDGEEIEFVETDGQNGQN